MRIRTLPFTIIALLWIFVHSNIAKKNKDKCVDEKKKRGE